LFFMARLVPHAATAESVLASLGSDRTQGVSSGEVEQRRRAHGSNELPEPQKQRALQLLVAQFRSIIVVLLAVAAAIGFLTGDPLEGTAILVVLVLNALIGFFTEWQAGRALDALRKQMHVIARVRRDGKDQQIGAENLVVGDIVLVTAGDRVPADLRVVEAAALRAEESALTGESRTVSKSVDAVAESTPVAERTPMLFLGTAIAAGRGVAVVTAVGETTELGRIGRLVGTVEQVATPLQKRLDVLGRRLVWIVLTVALVVAVTGWARGDSVWLMAEVAISLAVAAVPEALPAVTTFILAFGVLRMAKRRAIVRRLNAVETLGSTTVICSDKTGTLTMNRMTVTRLWPDTASTAANELMVLCNDASGTSGDPTEIALLDFASSRGVDTAQLRANKPRVTEYPFDSQTKRMVTVHRQNGQFLWALKGAPAVVLDACSRVDRAAVEAENVAMAASGLRVLALASKLTDTTEAPLMEDYEFCALIGMQDPPRPDVANAIAEARNAGIRVIMLTGDQLDTARAIANQLGLAGGDAKAMHARDLPETLADALGGVDAFARVSPEDKYRIVEALQKCGHVVAVTGDGVNDAPALKRSDVGIAMGERGTEVAKEAADIVLADDNFSTIVAAIEGGRTIYANIQKFVHLMLSQNLAEIVTIFGAIAIGWPLPLLPLHILWMNLVTDVFPAFALALEPAATGVMQRPPRPRDEPLLDRSLLILGTWQAAVLGAVSLAAYRWALLTYGSGTHARTVALFTLVAVQMAQTFNCRSRTQSAFSDLFRNPHVWFATGTVLALQFLALYVVPLRKILGLELPAPADWLVFGVAAAIPICVVELQKLVVRMRLQKASRVASPDASAINAP
jgi:Ca2+-transporting ATPase